VTTQKAFFAPGGWPLGMPGSARVSPIRLGASLPSVPLSAGEEILRTADQPHGIADEGVVTAPVRDRRESYPAVPRADLVASGAGLVLMTAPLLLGSGTMLAHSDRLLDAASRGAIDLATADAAARGITDGATVIVQSRHGKVTAQARIVPAMPAGRAFLAENAPGVRTNLLLAWSDLLPRVEVSLA